MTTKKNIFAIIGSASKNSSNLKLVSRIRKLTEEDFDMIIFEGLSGLPPFNPERSIENTPQSILDFRAAVLNADGIIICTPEYIFSIPSGLKNAIEWCVSTTVFAQKPIGLITASANGQKGHEELQLIMKTVETIFTEATTLLIQGIKGKIDGDGNILDRGTDKDLMNFIRHYKELVIRL